MPTLILLNKPFRVLSQFTDERSKAPRNTLADYIGDKGFYPAGRLDYDSEGLLLLTDNGQLQQQISHPRHKMPKTYWVQVEGPETPEALEQLRKGVTLKDGPCLPAQVEIINEPALWQRDPPVRFRQTIPTHWLSITIVEGRNRQVRRMTAAVGLPTLRLVRTCIGDWHLDQLMPGEYKKIHIPDSAMPKSDSTSTRTRRTSGHAKQKPRKHRNTKPNNNSPYKKR